MLKPIPVALATLALLAALLTPAQAEMRMTRISVSQSQGDDGALPKLPISTQWGLALSFIKTGEKIQQVRIGDPSRIVTDFDTPLEGQQNSGASVIYLRQLAQPLNLDLRLPGAARHSNQVPMTVVTQGRQGLNLYQFQLSLGEATHHSAVEVVPDAALTQTQTRTPIRLDVIRPIKPGQLPLPPLQSTGPEPVTPAPETTTPVRLKPLQRHNPQVVQAF